MKYLRLLQAALLGCAVVFAMVPGVAVSETVTVVRKGTNQNLKIDMNRAVVVESEVPFAELSIANPAIADFSTLSDRTVYLLGKTPGRTTLTLLDATGRLITNVEVHVSPDVAEFKERLQQILPGERIEVRTANDGIVLSGVVSSTARMDRALSLAQRYAPDRVSNLMSVAGSQQVMLKVRFAEMQRSISKGLNGSVLLGNSDFSAATGTFLLPENAGLAPGDPLTLAEGSLGGLGIGFDIGSVAFDVLLEALENKGLVRTLAEPNLTTLSGQEAYFLAGGEIPIPVQDEDGVTIEFRPFGVELNFTPRVVDEGLINLELATAVSSLDPTNGILAAGFDIDAFSRREASTTVVMRDGESFAIAGLLQDDFSDSNAQIPWLGDIPVLGTLFRSTSYQRNQSELVIIISAHLVSPTKGDAFILPTDRVKLPTEKDLFLNGRVAINPGERNSGAGEVAQQDFNGSYGYVMD
ncbi:type II and III secretion system protein family protein [Roseovarius phycicola]|uniref:Type II and III secretion system protein family protein n=1 Tax=Roseovarius phycicola TaxID=3080976 RepID=A0ABZ2HHM5_9RHOB